MGACIMCYFYDIKQEIYGKMICVNDFLAGWLTSDALASEKLKIATYRQSVAMLRLEGKGLLSENPVDGIGHVEMQLLRGCLRMTANGERMEFNAPCYIDFIPDTKWESLCVSEDFCATLLFVEDSFFRASSESIRFKIFEKMLWYVKHPFVMLNATDAERLQAWGERLFTAIDEGSREHLFGCELVQGMIGIFLFELWNIVFIQAEGDLYLADMWRQGDLTSRFIHLLHRNCRDKHEVSWYAEQLCVSVNTLSATLKRAYGKTAGAIIVDELLSEAKVCLRNPAYSVQTVAEMLSFSDQSAFGKFFKRYSGMSPGLFRKQVVGLD